LLIIDNSNSIKSDSNIERKDQTIFLRNENSYLENFTSALRNLNNGNISIEDHYKLIIFCYQVRNNIFHGLKKATEMIESGQRDRLLNYSQIILATIEMFFEILKTKHNYWLATEDELKENAKISY
jgi:maltoporin